VCNNILFTVYVTLCVFRFMVMGCLFGKERKPPGNAGNAGNVGNVGGVVAVGKPAGNAAMYNATGTSQVHLQFQPRMLYSYVCCYSGLAR